MPIYNKYSVFCMWVFFILLKFLWNICHYYPHSANEKKNELNIRDAKGHTADRSGLTRVFLSLKHILTHSLLDPSPHFTRAWRQSRWGGAVTVGVTVIESLALGDVQLTYFYFFIYLPKYSWFKMYHFWCTAKWFVYTYIYIFFFRFFSLLGCDKILSIIIIPCAPQ